ncbi:MAG: hypothetical protein IJZ29_06005 [Clostridia bacterium]|nr:hypothetical protein [Clostridia bacterium]MBQ8749999.1 hypothetical protein [Clostridia bacterium]
MVVLYFEESIKSQDGVILKTGKYGPFENEAEIDYFCGVKRKKDSYKLYYETKIERVDTESINQPLLFNKYTNEQLKILIERQLNLLDFNYGNFEDDEALQIKKVFNIFKNALESSIYDNDKYKRARINQIINSYLTFSTKKGKSGFDFKLKDVPSEILKTLENLSINHYQNELYSNGIIR